MKALRIAVMLFVFAGMATFNPAEAQFKKLRKKGKDKIEQKAKEKQLEKERKLENKVDEKLDDAVEGAEDSAQSVFQKKAEEAMASMAGLAEEPFDLGPNQKGSATAPFVMYRSVTEMNFPGMEKMPDMFKNLMTVNEVHYFHDGRSRTDSRDVSNIADGPGRRMISIDHVEGTYSIQTFESLAAMIDGMSKDIDDEEIDMSDMPDASDMKVSVDDTGLKEKINGVLTSQRVMVIEGNFTNTTEGGTKEGKVFFVTDARVSDEVAGHQTVADINLEIARAMGAAFGNAGSSFSGLFQMMQQDPQMSDQMNDAIAEMKKMGGGLPIRSDTYIVQAPKDHVLDIDAVLSGVLASQEEMQAAQNGNITKQLTMLSARTTTGDLSADKFSSDVMGIPDDYEQVEAITDPWAKPEK